MITLIIFLFFIISMLTLLTIMKIAIIFKLNIKNSDLKFEYKIFSKERHINNQITGFFKSGSAKFDTKILLDVSEVIDIEALKTNIVVSTPFIHLTNIGVLFFSYLIPALYNIPFKKKKGLYFKVMPSYNTWDIDVSVNGKIKISFISMILIFLKIRKRLKNIRTAQENV